MREFACKCLREMPTDELIDFLPQLIQVRKSVSDLGIITEFFFTMLVLYWSELNISFYKLKKKSIVQIYFNII